MQNLVMTEAQLKLVLVHLVMILSTGLALAPINVQAFTKLRYVYFQHHASTLRLR